MIRLAEWVDYVAHCDAAAANVHVQGKIAMCRTTRLSILTWIVLLVGNYLSHSAFAAIATTGNVTGTGTPYNGNDDPWAVTNLVVGDTAVGTMSITGGSKVNNTNDGIITNSEAAKNSSVTVDGANSKWTNSGGLIVGVNWNATLDIKNGGSVTSADSRVGGYGLSRGNPTSSATLDGGNSNWTVNGELRVGSGHHGKLTIKNGGSVSSKSGLMGFVIDVTSNVLVDGTGSTWTVAETLKLGGSRTLNSPASVNLTITGGGTVASKAGIITEGENTGNGVGVVTVSGTGSKWTNSASLTVGDPNENWTSKGTLNIGADGLVTAKALDGGNTRSSVNMNGGTLRITGTDSAVNLINLNDKGGTIDVPTNGTTFTLTNAINGNGALTKTGAATLELTGGNNYTGNTTVSAGTLKLSGSGSFENSPTVSLADGTKLNVTGVTGGGNWNGVRFKVVTGQTFKGKGKVDGDFDVDPGGKVDLGNSIGTLSTDSIQFLSGSTLHAEIILSSPIDADLLNVSGLVELNNSILSLSLLGGPSALVPNTFLIVANDAADPVSGVFGSVLGLPSGYFATVDYEFAGTDALGRTGDGNDIAITLAAVPEPATIIVWGLVLMSLALGSKHLGKLAV